MRDLFQIRLDRRYPLVSGCLPSAFHSEDPFGATDTDDAIGNRIVNGTDARPGQFPFMVSLRQGEQHICGGSIINEFWILTAAHCVYRSSLFDVQAGTTELSADAGTVVSVYKAIYHPNYSEENNYENDIAVLQLMTPLTFNGMIQPVKLPEEMQETPGGTSATLIGWGYPYSGGMVMPTLQMVELQVYSDEDCLKAHSGRPHSSNICAGVPEGGKGQCSGDSGGPLLSNGYEVGIVSWSRKPCAIKGYPGVFTEVSHYIKWIQSTINFNTSSLMDDQIG
ncbi:trypsin-like [Anabrus simplex]|uniref:trypsin-like n=1 Tax=Anabrus simplex TaxID=316456 RepID=UPI0035A382C7